MKIPKSILEPFGVIGVPLIRVECSPDVIEATLTRLMNQLACFPTEDIKEALEVAVLILGANSASCLHSGSGLTGNYLLGYELPNGDMYTLRLREPVAQPWLSRDFASKRYLGKSD